jgi:diguanylate cyclase (GGDEF)-like protein
MLLKADARSAIHARNVRCQVWALLVLLLLTAVAAIGWLLFSMRAGDRVEAQQRLSRTVQSARATLDHQLDSLDAWVHGLDELQALGGNMQSIMALMVRQNHLLGDALVLDGQGRVLAAARPYWRNGRMPLPQWERLKQSLADPMGSGVPLGLSLEAEPQPMLYWLRPLVKAGADCYLLLSLPRAHWAAFLTRGLELGDVEFTLEGQSGEVLLALPAPAREPPDSQALPALSQAPAGNVARLSRKPALVAVQNLPGRGLWLSASLPMDKVPNPWRRLVLGLCVAMAVFALLAAALWATVRGYLLRLRSMQLLATQSQQRLDQALDSMGNGFLLLDAQRQILQWNHGYEGMFPWQKGELASGRPLMEVLGSLSTQMGLNQEQLQALRTLHEQLLAAPGTPVEQQLPGGQFVQMRANAVADGGMVITYNDVTDIRRAVAEIESLAFYDALTGLPNRRLLLDRLAKAAEQACREGRYGALMLLNLDQFKMLNDTLGHEVGDLLLRQVAKRLQGAVRSCDMVARLGGDEFVVMLGDLAHAEASTQALHIGEKILARLNQPYTLGLHTHRTACSMGATLFGQRRQSAAELLKQADIAMDQIKSRKGSGLCFFDPQMQIEIQQRVRMEEDLRVAMAQSQFELHYQPQFTLDGEVIGAEALLRWRHPERGLVPPGMFIAVAEDSEIIVPLGMWVLRTACEQLALWQKDARLCHLQVSVNVSARQFRHEDFAARVVEVLRETGISPQLLKLELTESLVIENVEQTIATMTQLRALGLCFSMDDFGTGQSSLTYLTRLPLSQLKIDQSFIRNMGHRYTDDVIVQTIIGMARNLNLEAIAEGVETQEQRAMLASYGCTYFQGYLFSPPVPLHVFEQLLERVPVRMAQPRA